MNLFTEHSTVQPRALGQSSDERQPSLLCPLRRSVFRSSFFRHTHTARPLFSLALVKLHHQSICNDSGQVHGLVPVRNLAGKTSDAL